MSDRAALNGRMRDRRHVFALRVYYEDTDALGIVYNARYLNFAERARTAFLNCHGVRNRDMTDRHKVAIGVRKAEIDFIKAARLEDELRVITRLDRIGGASLRIHQTIKRDDEVICEIKTVLVSMCLETFKAKRLPPDLRRLFRTIEGDGDENMSEDGGV